MQRRSSLIGHTCERICVYIYMAEPRKPPCRYVYWSDFFVHDVERSRMKEPGFSVPVFQFPETRGVDWLALKLSPETCPRPTDAELIQCIRDHVGSEAGLGQIEIDDFIGHEYVKMEWKDRKYFWTAMEAFLKRGISVGPQCHMRAFWLAPEDLSAAGASLTVLTADNAMIHAIRRYISKLETTRSHGITMCPFEHHLYLWHQNSWRTPEGRQFVKWLREYYHKNGEDAESSDEEKDLVLLGEGEDEKVVHIE